MNFKQATTQVLILSVIQRGALQTHCLQHWGIWFLLTDQCNPMKRTICRTFFLTGKKQNMTRRVAEQQDLPQIYLISRAILYANKESRICQGICPFFSLFFCALRFNLSRKCAAYYYLDKFAKRRLTKNAISIRADGRSENLEGASQYWGIICPPG